MTKFCTKLRVTGGHIPESLFREESTGANIGTDERDLQVSFPKPWLCYGILTLILLLTASVRYGLLDIPLERDEGEYAYAGQLILQGFMPYQDLYSMKLPGIYAAYAGILSLFGQTQTGIHTGLLLINAATIFLIFLLARRLIDPFAGLMAAASFAVLSVNQSVQGVFANAEHFVILPAVSGLFFLLKAMDENRQWLLFCSGLLLGIGFLIKQHGAAFVAFGAIYLVIAQLRSGPVSWPGLLSRCSMFAFGAAVPYGATCLIFVAAGIFGKFWFWTVDYPRAYTSMVHIEHAWVNFKYVAMYIGKSAPLIWMLAGFGLIGIGWDRHARRRWIFVVMFVLFSFLAICPGFYFRPHYFILILPAAVLLAGIGISGVANSLSKLHSRSLRYGLPALLCIICLTVSVFQQRHFLFQMSSAEACRSTYGLNPFPESLEISEFIRDNTKKEDRIAVLGSEPQIYFFSGRRSATGYIYMYPLMENHDFALKMQEEMIKEIESARPEILVFVRVGTSWLRRPDSHRLLFEWFLRYQANHYVIVGLVELSNLKTLYHWAPDIKWPPRSGFWVAVLKKRTRVGMVEQKIWLDPDS